MASTEFAIRKITNANASKTVLDKTALIRLFMGRWLRSITLDAKRASDGYDAKL